jgi:cytochrome subunit of sulfide dehydrogenase
MLILRPLLAALLIVAAAPASQAEMQTPPPGASSCSGCHAAKKSVETPVPPLVGRNPADIEAAMTAFRSGDRPSVIMQRIAKGFSDNEVKAIAAWYGTQKY